MGQTSFEALVPKLLLILAVSVASSGCGTAESRAPEAVAPQPIGVHRLVVEQIELVVPVFGTGTIAAHKTTEVGPRVDGIIEEIFVNVGDRVQAGAPLFKTRQVHYRIRVDETSQLLRLAQAELRNATRERDRFESLHSSNIASDDRLDDVRTGRDLAAARLGQAKAVHARALQELEDTVVRASYPGAITHR